MKLAEVKVTTEDCCKFLAQLAKDGVITATWAWEDGDDDGENVDAQRLKVESTLSNHKKWKREWKVKPGKGGYQDDDRYEVTVNGRHGYEPASNFTVERKFQCDQSLFDGQVAYLVLERPNGELVLGDYVGD